MSRVHRHRLLLVTIILCVLILAISFAFRTPNIGYDGRQYETYARHILSERAYTYDGEHPSYGRAPGYPLFLAGILSLTGDFTSIYLLQVAMLGFAFVLMGAIYSRAYRDCGDRRPVLVFGHVVALALILPLHELAMDVKSETLFLVLTFAAIFLLLRFMHSHRRVDLLWSAVLLGCSAYVRPVNVFASLTLAVFFFLRGHLRKGEALVYAAVGLLVIAPWTVRNASLFHRFVPVSANGAALYSMADPDVFRQVLVRSGSYAQTIPQYQELLGNGPQLELDHDADARFTAWAVELIKGDPLGFLLRGFLKSLFHWSYLPGTKDLLNSNPTLFGVCILVQLAFLTSALRGWRLMRKKTKGAADLIAGYALYTAIALFPFYAESRYLIPVYILMFGCSWYWFVRPHGLVDRLLNRLQGSHNHEG